MDMSKVSRSYAQQRERTETNEIFNATETHQPNLCILYFRITLFLSLAFQILAQFPHSIFSLEASLKRKAIAK